MKFNLKIFLITISTLTLMFFTVFLFIRNTPKMPKEELIYHNKKITELIGNAKTISLRDKTSLLLKPSESALPNKNISVSTRDEIDNILKCLILENLTQPTGIFHKCFGNIEIKITMADSKEFIISYDHGNGIHGIDNGSIPTGFVELNSKSCDKLNKLLHKEGFTKEEIGYN